MHGDVPAFEMRHGRRHRQTIVEYMHVISLCAVTFLSNSDETIRQSLKEMHT